MTDVFTGHDVPPGEEMARFLRAMSDDISRRTNPVFEGHRTTYPGQVNFTWQQAVGYGSMIFGTRAAAAFTAKETLAMPARSLTVESDPHGFGSYHAVGTGEVYYPGGS